MNAIIDTTAGLHTKYEKTFVLDFDKLLKRASLPCHEVRNTGNIYSHKPMVKQGRFASASPEIQNSAVK
jgi:hypothetical protein